MHRYLIQSHALAVSHYLCKHYISVIRPPAKNVTHVAVAHPSGAALGIDSGWCPESGWARMDVNREDPVEVELAADLHVSALSHVEGSTCNTY